MSDDISSRLRLVTPPVSEPITLSEAKLFLRIEHDADDAVITRAIAAAREAAEQYLKAALLPQLLAYNAGCSQKRRLALPIGPATAIESVTLVASDGGETVLDEEDFRLSMDGYVLLFDNVVSGSSVVVEYHAALADTASALPALLKQGILHHIAVLVEQRDGLAAMPQSSLACYQPFRRISL